MAELELTKIISGINAMFTEDNHFVFWYDETGDFRENIPEITAKLDQPVVVMNARDQFKTKLKLTEMQRSGKYALVYSPAPRPSLDHNLLADFLYYSKTYATDPLTMLQEELNLKPTDKKFLKKYSSFFTSKVRKKDFKALNYNHQPLELVLLAAIAKASRPSLSAILQVICKGSLGEDNETLAKFKKYNTLDVFWKFIDRAYGFQNIHNTPFHLFAAMLLNMAYDQAKRELPISLNEYTLAHTNNAIIFIQNTRNLIDCQVAMQQIATEVWQFVNCQDLFRKMDIAQLAHIDVFPEIEHLIAKWITEKILADDFEVQIDHMSISELIASRCAMAYGKICEHVYQIQADAIKLLTTRYTTESQDLSAAIDSYVNQDYKLDTSYRQFTVACADIEPDLESIIDGIQNKVENAYLNGFLSDSVHDWNSVYSAETVPSNLYQRNFYRKFVSNNKDRVVVLISDAFRFEAAKALQAQLDAKDMMTTNMKKLITGLPSVTYFGMPALLPNRNLTYDGEKSVLIDGQTVNTTEKREQVLQKANFASVAELVGNFNNMNTAQRRTFLAEQKVVYLYDNHVDTTGEKSVTEQEVFAATQRAINHLARTIEILRNLSVRHIIITADHGYIFRHSPLDSANKIEISDVDAQNAGLIKKEQRYAISEQALATKGTAHQKLGVLLGNDDSRSVNYPKNFDIFQTRSSSQNYVHGGSSAQEMIVPVLDVLTHTGQSKAEPAKIHDVTAVHRITARDTVVQLMQDDAISDLTTEAIYQVYFVDDDEQKISGVHEVVTDSRAKMPTNRVQSIHLTLKDAKYMNGHKYMLVLRNVDTGKEFRTIYTMDMVVGGEFGFDI